MTIPIKVKPFLVPNLVGLELPAQPLGESVQQSISLPLEDVDADTLSLLCDDFRRSAFVKAGKKDPAQP